MNNDKINIENNEIEHMIKKEHLIIHHLFVHVIVVFWSAGNFVVTVLTSVSILINSFR